jgi:hypothetical protein
MSTITVRNGVVSWVNAVVVVPTPLMIVRAAWAPSARVTTPDPTV